jgi:type II secretory ATPase GspE/PulE/Tfp pilus assembly ATPase PilB-like protein
LELLTRPRGLVLISGPSSSGKTTTIYASLQHLMSGPRAGQRAVSLEDPIEFPLACASQLEVAPEKGLTFDRLLANVLRQDAEVIVVGEIRDAATAGIALRAALTGHLILSTVHCGSALEVPRRLIDLGLDAGPVAEALAGVVAQRLLRALCPHCREEGPASAEERDRLALPADLVTVHRARGCPQCADTGYRGRTVVAELMPMRGGLAELVRGQASLAELQAAARGLGFAGLWEDALHQVRAGRTSLEEGRRILG